MNKMTIKEGAVHCTKPGTAALSVLKWVIVTVLICPLTILAQNEGSSDLEYKFSKEELTQMLAPIALYPDALVAQILMASTYPLEVVEADRWRSKNASLQGADLDTALQNTNWDPSIKSLCHFPGVLSSLSEKLDQTRKLGDAFLGQEDAVTAIIQELRLKAKAQGSLNTTNEQKVTVEKDIVKIEPANPEVIYVPVYDPAYVYGPWWYPAYPPYYWYYPPGIYSGAYIGFGAGIYFGFNAFSWAWFDWPVRRVHIDISRTRSFNYLHGRDGNSGNMWRHDPRHRRGVAYRDLRTSQTYRSRTLRAPTIPSITERRGYSGVNREQQRIIPAQPDHQRPVVRDTPFRGVGEGSFERKAGERGGVSNRSIEVRPRPEGFSDGQRLQRQGGGSFSGEGTRGGGQGRSRGMRDRN